MFRHIKDDLKQSKSLFVSLDGKSSVVRDLPLKLFGLQVGYLFNKRTNIYLGYYNSYNDSKKIFNPTAGAKGLDYDSNTVWQQYHLNYLNLGCEYYFYDSRKWRFSIPFAIGIGSGTDRQYMLKGTLEEHKYRVAPLELGFIANYKICWWLWAGAGMGSRISLASTRFNGSYFSLGLSLKTGEMYKRFRTWYKNQ